MYTWQTDQILVQGWKTAGRERWFRIKTAANAAWCAQQETVLDISNSEDG